MAGSEFIQRRHQRPCPTGGAADLIVACPPLRSRVNLARIVRAAGCCGVTEMIVAGKSQVDRKIARDALEQIQFHEHRTLPPVLAKWQARGYRLVGLEQATHSIPLHDFQFQPKTILVVGHERLGIEPDLLKRLDAIIEIPVYGRPASYNVATATAMALYEYCRQRRKQSLELE